MAPIALALVELDADIVVITEFRSRTGGQIRAALHDHGWVHQAASRTPEDVNGVLLASRHPLREVEIPRAGPLSWSELTTRLVLAELEWDGAGLWVLGAHVPCAEVGSARQAVFGALVKVGGHLRSHPGMILGDLNAGRHGVDERGATLENSAMLGRLSTLGFVDAWRALHPEGREYSWFSHLGEGFRIDHALASAPLAPRVRSAWYEHSLREDGLSDHSALLVEVG